MKTLAALLLLAAALPLSAQYGPPAKDLDEGQFFMREILRQLEPAMFEARDRAAVFALVSTAHNRLAGKLPATELSAAMAMLDDFTERRERAGRPLSRENRRTIDAVRKELELAQPPYAIEALRERLHHEFVHNLERQVLRDMAKLEALEEQWTMFRQRYVAPIEREAKSGIATTAAEMRND